MGLDSSVVAAAEKDQRPQTPYFDGCYGLCHRCCHHERVYRRWQRGTVGIGKNIAGTIRTTGADLGGFEVPQSQIACLAGAAPTWLANRSRVETKGRTTWLRGAAASLGGRAHFCLDGPQPPLEQRLRTHQQFERGDRLDRKYFAPDAPTRSKKHAKIQLSCLVS